MNRLVLIIIAFVGIGLATLGLIFFLHDGSPNQKVVTAVVCTEGEPSGDAWYWRKAGEVGSDRVLSFRDEDEKFLGYHILAERTSTSASRALSLTHDVARLHFSTSSAYYGEPFNVVPVCYKVESDGDLIHTAKVLYRVEYILPVQIPEIHSLERVQVEGYAPLPLGVVGDF